MNELSFRTTSVQTGMPRADLRARSATVTAVLGPTNTGKTHFALDRMVSHTTGIIGLPLRLLAREVYMRLIERVGVNQVALITGEEKIKPKTPRFWVATVEAMPRDLDVSFVAIDEIQLAATLDRGHVFTDRLLNRRGRDETLLIGAGTMEEPIRRLLPQATVITRPRLSKLSFAGEKKLSRLPRRSAIVAFSAEDVYAIAELIRRQRGGAAVVMGALSPRTRNAQVELFQSGDVDYIIATDAIGMGLNLDLDHVAFASDRKFDGYQFRRLNPAEFGQIAGRAGRFMRDGTFGTSGRCPPFDEELIEAVEDHRFDPVGLLQWRNSDLDFSSIRALQASLDRLPTEAGLTRAPLAEDVLVLDIAARDPSTVRQVNNRADVARLWEACQIPDYRKVSPAAHAELVLSLFHFIVRSGRIPDDWFAEHLAQYDRTEGDIDILSNRIAQVRTLSFIANRPDWLRDPEHWQGVTRQVEDRLSDALHERLAQRFVDRRTSVLMRRLRENVMLEAEVTAGGDVIVEGEHVGQLHGFRFTADPKATGEAARALNAAAQQALGAEIEARANRFAQSVDESIALANDGTIRWLGDPIAKIANGDKLLAPRVRILADEHLTGTSLETVQRRLNLWMAQHVKKLLGPLMELETGEDLDGIARGIAFQLAESLGVLERSRVAEDVKGLDQAARAILRKKGIRFGAYHIYLPLLLKPAPRALAAQLWALRHGGVETVKGLDEVPHLASSGRTSFAADSAIPKGLYRAAGFRVCGARAVRVDILERLADLIRPAIAYRPGTTPGTPPPGAADNDGFVTTVGMTSLAGCSGEDFASILRSLGYVVDRRPGPAITVPLLPVAATTPITPQVAAAAPGGDGTEPDAPEVPAEDPPATVPDAPLEEPPHPDEDEPPNAPDEVPPPIGEPGDPDREAPPIQAATIGSVMAEASSIEASDAAPADEAAIEVEFSQPAEPDKSLVAKAVDAVSDAAAGALSFLHVTSVPEDQKTPIEAATIASVLDEAPALPSDPESTDPTAATSVPAEAGSGDPSALPGPEDDLTGATIATPAAEQSPAAPSTAGIEVGEQPERGSAGPSVEPGPEIVAEAIAAEAGPDSLSAVDPSSGQTQSDATSAADDLSGDAPAAESSDTARPNSTEETTPAEPVLIEVWRPHRTHHHAQRRPERNRHQQGQRAGHHDRQGSARTDGSAGAPAVNDGPRPERQNRPRRDGRPGFGQRPQGGEHRPPRPEGGGEGQPQRHGGKPHFDNRRDRPRGSDRNEGRTGGKPQAWSSAERPQRERQPDPDSPFAKLLALKADLEAKSKKD